MDVNSELDAMRNYIANINYCTSKIQEVKNTESLHETIVNINIATISTTLYALASAFFEFNGIGCIIWGGTGGIIGYILGELIFQTENKYADTSWWLTVLVIASSMLCFLIFYTYIPIIFVLINWLYTIRMNYKLKKEIWKIANNLEKMK
ncbi:MAG: hypothetical protein IKJ01_09115 [Lachnospiraceae bacterium]|nr:hypothetical protein [Lachnospiraceae bacterium]